MPGSNDKQLVSSLVAVAATITLNLAGVMGGVKVVGYNYVGAPTSANMLSVGNLVGVFMFIAGIILGPLSFGWTLSYLSGKTGANKSQAVGLYALAAAGGSVAAVIGSRTTMFKPPIVTTPPTADPLANLMGGFIIVVYSLMAAAAFCVAGRLLKPHLGCARKPAAAAPKPIQRAGPHWPVVGGFFVILTLIAFMTTFLSNVWNYSWPSYFASNGVSVFSYNGQTITTVYNMLIPSDDPSAIPPYFTSNGIQVFFKLYSDVLVFFLCIGVLVGLGVAASASAAMRRRLHKRLRVRKLPAQLDLFPTGVTVGELAVISVVVGLFCYWFWYWSTGYPRIQQETEGMGDPYPGLQNYARVLGHMTTLSMSFLTFPVTRNSVWEASFGIPFDRAVKYHRVMGRFCWLLVTLHMILWDIKWAAEGTLWNNVVNISNLLIANNPAGLHNDNFTIPIVELAWLLMTAAVIAANFARRKNWEVFQYLHYVSWFFFVAALFHAWGHWYYTAAGLLLYALDKIARLVRSSQEVAVLGLAHAAGVTKVTVDARVFAARGGHYAGQYAWVHFPALSAFQWHPFTISSPPPAVGALAAASAAAAAPVGTAAAEKLLPLLGEADASSSTPTLTFHIKDMGPKTWTGQLAALANATAPAEVPALSMAIDGPYGNAGAYGERPVVVLVAGGIGITPMLAIATDLANRSRDPATYGSPGAVRQVHLVWIVRDMALVAAFADGLAALMDPLAAGSGGSQVAFELHLHCTGAMVPADEAAAAPVATGMVRRAHVHEPLGLVRAGRPDLHAVFRAAVADAGALAGSASLQNTDVSALVSALVCGPETLTRSVSDIAFEFSTDFHAEVFAF